MWENFIVFYLPNCEQQMWPESPKTLTHSGKTVLAFRATVWESGNFISSHLSAKSYTGSRSSEALAWPERRLQLFTMVTLNWLRCRYHVTGDAFTLSLVLTMGLWVIVQDAGVDGPVATAVASGQRSSTPPRDIKWVLININKLLAVIG